MEARLALLAFKRQELVDMARSGEVEDTVMWEVQQLLDHEEVRLEALLDSASAQDQARPAR